MGTACSLKNALRFIGPQTCLAADDYLLLLRKRSCLGAQLSKGHVPHCRMRDALLLKLLGAAHIEKDKIIAPVEFFLHGKGRYAPGKALQLVFQNACSGNKIVHGR